MWWAMDIEKSGIVRIKISICSSKEAFVCNPRGSSYGAWIRIVGPIRAGRRVEGALKFRQKVKEQ